MNTDIIGEKRGTITVSVYEDINEGFKFFGIESDNKELIPVIDVIQNSLEKY